jgi:hypothetical protein
VVGSLFGLGLVGALAFFAWREKDALAARWSALVGGRRPPIVTDDELLASAYDTVGAAGGVGVGRLGAGGDVYASL